MTAKSYDIIQIENKWQKEWFDNKIYQAEKKRNKKFFIHFAYPGVSGYLHVGHMRGFTYSDIIARYKRMRGYDVLFPAGFHASGIPSIGFAKKIQRKDRTTLLMLREYGCDEETIKKLKDPNEVVSYFGKIYVEDYWKKFGFLIDYSRLMSTISKGYNKFIQWQFLKLKQRELLIQKPHFAPFCRNCGPVAVDKSETDILTGGSAEILEFTTIKFRMNDDTILPAATLRPETIFGVTNMWINPNIEYVTVKIDDEKWICSKEGATKLAYQYENIEILEETILGKELLGKTCLVPLVNRRVPILPGAFADPAVATGIVMSVPAHAPFDWIALVESGEKIKPISIIDVKDFGTNPAKEACEELGIHSQYETEKLNEATEIVYKKEFHTGYLNENCGIYAGIRISDIKDEVKNELIKNHLAFILREFSEEVICRCGEKVLIKKIPDQWFIKYSDRDLTEISKKYVKTMDIHPDEYLQGLPDVLDWFDDRACIREGSWLGTEFPFKKGWIIEPISDSTLYPAYYVISKYVNFNQLNPEDMSEAFFDYVFLSKGEPQNPIWKKIKDDVDYWYPVDINLGGKEHKTVHFPVFIMNHVAIMPESKWPKGLFVHWWVTQKGKEKISKSKGGAEHIAEAAEKYGVDAMRLYYAHVGSSFVDVEWDEETVFTYKNRITMIWNLCNQLLSLKENRSNNTTHIDKWLVSMINRRIANVNETFSQYDLRASANEIFFETLIDLRWYLKRGGNHTKTINYFLDIWIKLLTPYTPHLSEELWHLMGNTNYVSNENFPVCNKNKISERVENGESLLSDVIEDINEILKITKLKPKKIFIYTAPRWKKEMLNKSLTLIDNKDLNVGYIIKETLKDEKNKTIAHDIAKYAPKLLSEIKKLNEKDKYRYKVDLNENEYLKEASPYLKDVFSCDVEIIDCDKPNIYDPTKKSKYAAPLKPALYIE